LIDSLMPVVMPPQLPTHSNSINMKSVCLLVLLCFAFGFGVAALVVNAVSHTFVIGHSKDFAIHVGVAVCFLVRTQVFGLFSNFSKRQ
jgi:hypothetical protein